MKILRFIRITFAQAFYTWALREIDPMNPDVNKIVLRKRELEDEARRLFVC